MVLNSLDSFNMPCLLNSEISISSILVTSYLLTRKDHDFFTIPHKNLRSYLKRPRSHTNSFSMAISYILHKGGYLLKILNLWWFYSFVDILNCFPTTCVRRIRSIIIFSSFSWKKKNRKHLSVLLISFPLENNKRQPTQITKLYWLLIK